MVDLDSPKGEETSVLRLTAKVRRTYLAKDAVEEIEEGFIAIDGDKMRYEATKYKMLDYHRVIIDRGDPGPVYVLIPEMLRYFEVRRKNGGDRDKDIPGETPHEGKLPYASKFILGANLEPSDNLSNEVSRKRLGVEEVYGYACEKFVVTESSNGDFIRSYTKWSAVDLNRLPIKTEYKFKSGPDFTIMRWELIDIKMGPPPPISSLSRTDTSGSRTCPRRWRWALSDGSGSGLLQAIST
jgi:hypothetical protein